ncbi:putative ABC transport system permease protein [Dethiosulfatibacter aminovorans DSM 17477]|uniref:Putative ABC transport system permease protein n=1 Tax=Dethiosulfatibacter aminovorans DSM 17477 TaxID=1121476 RepID=A0A1M6GQY7_9FIRM|nr:putative ABC transport system permease protein [Dethiosulfatibacter aminovorans DSM 17477]
MEGLIIVKKLNLRLFRMIMHSRGQYISILIVVIAGLFMYTFMDNASTSLESSMNEFYDVTNFGDVFVELMQISDKETEELEKLENIESAEGRIVFDAPFLSEDKDEKVTLRIVSADAELNKISQLYVEEGKREIEEREILLLSQFATARGIEIGDEIDIQIFGRKYTFEVKGLVAHPEYAYIMENEQTIFPRPDKFGIAFIEKEYLGKITGLTGKYNDVVLKLDNYDKLKDTKKVLDEELDKNGLKRIIEKEDQLSNSILVAKIDGIKQVSGFIPVVFLFVAAAILAAMISRNVKKDKVIIGILKGLGYSRTKIIAHYTMYAVSIGIVGGGIGTILGTLMSRAMTMLFLEYFYIPVMKFTIYPENIARAMILSSIFCTFAGMFGARKAVSMTPADAIRDEPTVTGHSIFMERITFIWNRLTFSWKMIYKYIFREKKKSVFISLGAAFTVAMGMMTFWMIDMLTVVFINYFGGFLAMDYSVEFMQPVNENALKDLEKLIGPDLIEGKIELPFEMQYGREKIYVKIVGVEKDTPFYKFRDFVGNEVPLPDEGMIISSNLGTVLGVDVGDRILVRNFIPNMDDVYIEVKGMVNQNLGINGYMNINYMRETLAGKNTLTGALMMTDENISQELNELKNVGGFQSMNDMQDMFLEYLDLTKISISFMVFFSGILGFVIIYSMTMMSIHERKLEFSSLRVLGFTKGEIFNIILRENAVMSLVGMVYGLPMGKVIIDSMRTIYVTDMYVFNAPITVSLIIKAILYTILCLTLAQLTTYRKITNLDFIDALKSRMT